MGIVFVSSDRDEASFRDYFKEQPWLALPYNQRDRKETLSKKFKVRGIPSFVILDPEGETITTEGREAVSTDPEGANYPWVPPTAAEKAAAAIKNIGEDLMTQTGGKPIGLYFSAHWCPPCRGFTPKLAEWYKGIKGELGDKFEIIFCSGDKAEDDMKSYYKEQCDAGGDWLCLPYDKKDDLDPLFEISGIPTFLIVDPNGKVINKNGRGGFRGC